MRFEWDQAKNRRNQQKHRISFEDAALVFQDEDCLLVPDRIDPSGEQRWHAIGAVYTASQMAAILLVAHVLREDHDGEEIIRIISARPAEKHERRRYREQETS